MVETAAISLVSQVSFVTSWAKHKTKLEEVTSMLECLFDNEGIDSRLIEVVSSSLIFICEISIKSIEAVRRIATTPAKRNWLHQLRIDRIELEYDSTRESFPVSLLG